MDKTEVNVKVFSDKKRAVIKSIMTRVVAAISETWDIEKELERALGFDVDPLRSYFEDYAVAGSHFEPTDEDIELFLEYAAEHADGDHAAEEGDDGEVKGERMSDDIRDGINRHVGY
jgi:hypothetical protein